MINKKFKLNIIFVNFKISIKIINLKIKNTSFTNLITKNVNFRVIVNFLKNKKLKINKNENEIKISKIY